MAELAPAYPGSPPPSPALDAILALDEDSLPYSDNMPMLDPDEQQRPLTYSREGIRCHLRDRRDHIAVDGDMFVYYIGRGERGEPVKATLAPDVFVVFGVPDRDDRQSYVLWHEPEADIRFVLEIASTSTRTLDHTKRRDVYASLDVREYFVFDPPSRRRPAALLGLRLDDGVYRRIPTLRMPDGRTVVPSDVLGLTGHIEEGSRLRWFDPVTGEKLLDYKELADRAEAATRRAEAATRRAEAEKRRADDAKRRADELEVLLRKR